jgi:hypothetical protein
MSNELTLRDTFPAAAVAAVIYEAMRWERKESPPSWQDGNSLAEGRARMGAAEIAAILFGDRPASPVHDAAPAATATAAGMMGCKPDSPGTGETSADSGDLQVPGTQGCM